ncbi:MAG: hypothetical protein A2Y17_10985 [Clostridiales bacterium GWF2_38_85]|nr:MAG: hypothetical protein A2Y17_10985 [Clostridiales bacterium GWF2_38_85]
MFKKILSVLLVVFIVFMTMPNALASDIEADKLSDELQDALTSTTDELIDVYIALYDIDYGKVKAEAYQATKMSIESFDEKVSLNDVESYLTQKKNIAKKYYEQQNSAFVDSIANEKSTQIIFKSKYSPIIIARMSRFEVKNLQSNKMVSGVSLFQNQEVVNCSDKANSNSGATYVRDNLGKTGNGIKIGMIELGYPLVSTYSSLFNSNKVIRVGNTYLSSIEDNLHATRVAAIMVGQLYNNTYEGIVSDATLYFAQGDTLQSFYEGIEALIDNDIYIINMSAGIIKYADHRNDTVYDNFASWIDHLAFQHDVHFIAAAGNYYDDSGIIRYKIYSPAIGYNVIAVGSFSDNNTLFPNYTPQQSDLSDQVLPSPFMMSYFSCYQDFLTAQKPDIIAAGHFIEYGNIPNSYGGDDISSGTSFAAPQVTGIVAQLVQTTPSLLTNNSKMKALLTATAVYRVKVTQSPSVYDTAESGTSAFFERQGAGVVNARAAVSTSQAGKYADITLSSSAQYYDYYINVPSSYDNLRVSMCWIKKNSISGSHTLNPVVTEQPLANLKLEVYSPGGQLIATSDNLYNNVEIIQFLTANYGSGTYTIRIVNNSYNAGLDGYQYISLSWY